MPPKGGITPLSVILLSEIEVMSECIGNMPVGGFCICLFHSL